MCLNLKNKKKKKKKKKPKKKSNLKGDASRTNRRKMRALGHLLAQGLETDRSRLETKAPGPELGALPHFPGRYGFAVRPRSGGGGGGSMYDPPKNR